MFLCVRMYVCVFGWVDLCVCEILCEFRIKVHYPFISLLNPISSNLATQSSVYVCVYVCVCVCVWLGGFVCV